MYVSPCQSERCWARAAGNISIRRAARGVAAAWMATWGTQRCYESMVNGEWRRTWAHKAEAGIMAWRVVGVCGLAVARCCYAGAA